MLRPIIDFFLFEIMTEWLGLVCPCGILLVANRMYYCSRIGTTDGTFLVSRNPPGANTPAGCLFSEDFLCQAASPVFTGAIGIGTFHSEEFERLCF